MPGLTGAQEFAIAKSISDLLYGMAKTQGDEQLAHASETAGNAAGVGGAVASSSSGKSAFVNIGNLLIGSAVGVAFLAGWELVLGAAAVDAVIGYLATMGWVGFSAGVAIRVAEKVAIDQAADKVADKTDPLLAAAYDKLHSDVHKALTGSPDPGPAVSGSGDGGNIPGHNPQRYNLFDANGGFVGYQLIYQESDGKHIYHYSAGSNTPDSIEIEYNDGRSSFSSLDANGDWTTTVYDQPNGKGNKLEVSKYGPSGLKRDEPLKKPVSYIPPAHPWPVPQAPVKPDALKDVDDAAKKEPKGVIDPLVLNLAGRGLAATTDIVNGVYFDWDGDGFKEQTAWTGPGSGVLVNDPTDVAITSASQMFGDRTSLVGGGYAVDGFAALAALDNNHDNVMNSSDTAWTNLRVWVDENANGITDSGELKTLSSLGITSIGLSSNVINAQDSMENVHNSRATYTYSDGSTGEIDDITFNKSTAITKPSTLVSESSTIQALPDLSGYGQVTTLRQAMALDTAGTLLGYVQSFVAATDNSTRSSLVDQIIFRWTGVDGVSSTARGTYFDARKLQALEKFNGTSFIDPYNTTSNPGSQSVDILNVAYQTLHDEFLGLLEAQSNLKYLFDTVVLVPNDGASYYSFSDVQVQFTQLLASNRMSALATLSEFNKVAHSLGLDQGKSYAAFRTALVASGSDVAATFVGYGAYLTGTAGNDIITAWVGNQTINASQGGNDTLISGGGNVTVYGGGGSNLFIGGVGDNQIFYSGSNGLPAWGGDASNKDTFIAGTGTQTFVESASGVAEVYYHSGNGYLTINNHTGFGYWGGAIHVDQGITLDNLNVSNSFGYLNFTDGIAGDTIALWNRGIPTLMFADGSTINLLTLGSINHLTSGTTVASGTMDDHYIYNSGSGSVTINDGGGNNTLYMGSGIQIDKVVYTASGNNVIITDGVSGDTVTLINRSVQSVKYADGTGQGIYTAGNDYLLTANVTLSGSAGNDTYTYSKGTGVVTISDAIGANTLSLTGGITSGNLVFSSAGNDLLITDGQAGDQIVIKSQLAANPAVTMINFSGGGSLSLNGITMGMGSGQTTLTGTLGGDTLTGAASGSQTIKGNGGNDIFIAGTGTSTLIGAMGDDTYSFISGHGKVSILDTGGVNILKFGTGILSSNVSLTGSGSDLLITDGVAGDTITLVGQLSRTPPLSQMVFASGTTSNLIGINISPASGVTTLNGTFGNDTLNAGAGSKTLIGISGDDTYVGGLGTQVFIGNTYAGNSQYIFGGGVATAYGSTGNETYSYAAGKGLVTIYEGGGHNTIALASGLTVSNITLAASGADLLITDGTAGDTITLKNQLTSAVQVDAIRFSDSSTKSLVGVTLAATTGTGILYGTSGDDKLTGLSGTQTLSGNGGNDIFITGGGSATAIGGLGNDIYSYTGTKGLWTIQDTAGINTLVLGSGITKANVALKASGNDLIITDGIAGDTITLKNQLSTSIGMTTLIYPDASTLSLQGLALTMPASGTILNGTPGADTLTATSGTQTLTGNGGGDKFIGSTGNQTFIGSTANETFTGGTGTQVMTGNDGGDVFIAATGRTTVNSGNGNDIYSFNSGSGTMVIGDLGGTDTLKFGTGLNAANIKVSESVDGADLLITDGVSGDVIQLVQAANGGFYAWKQLETIIYGDGTTASLSSLPLYAQTGNSTLYGASGNDTLIAVNGTGVETLLGNAGNDLYSYSSGNGTVVLSDNNGGGTDILKLGAGLTAANVTFSGSGNDLIITDGVAGDKVTILNQFNPAFNYTLEALVYGDGSTASLTAGLKLVAVVGNTTLNGTSGNDTLTGSAGTQTLNGNGGNDTLIGATGTYTMFGNGTNGNNIFIAGTGVTTAYGGSGNDNYSFSSGGGTFVINDSSGTDILRLGTGLTAANVKISGDGSDMLITDGVAGDLIRIVNGNAGPGWDIKAETLVYGDGTTISLNGMLAYAQTGSSTLKGTSGNDTLVAVAGATSETLLGYGGDDIYSFSSGNGSVVISDNGGNDTLKLGSGLTAANVTLTGSGYDLLITDGVAGDQIKIVSQSYNPSFTIETLIYGDGSIVNLGTAPLTAAPGNTTLNGTSANNILIATTGNQTINGQGGSDNFIGGTGTQIMIGSQGTNGNNVFIAATGVTTAYGGSGSDLYSYESGKGTMVISDSSGTDTLKLGAGLTAANIIISETSNAADLLITDGISGDTIRIINGGQPGFYGPIIETLIYGDGTSIALATNMNLTAQSGNSTLNGSSGNDTLVAVNGTGTETLFGNGGNDVYSYSSGNGTVYISDNNGGGTDTLKLGAGLTASNVSLFSNGYDMIIKDGVSGDQITLYSHFYNANYAIDYFVYGDGTTVNLLNGAIITATSGNTTLNGSAGGDTLIASTGNQTINGNSGNDTFIGGTGTQVMIGNQGWTNGNGVFIAGTGVTTAYGGSGNDLYSYDSGKGVLVISEGGGTDTLKLGSGLTAANVTFSETGNDLLITDGISGDTIRIINGGATGFYGPIVETLVYGDGTSVSLSSNLTLVSQSGNATLTGTSGSDTLIAVNGTGTETLLGNGGNDVYSYSSGNGTVFISDNNGGGTDTLKLGAGLTASNVSLFGNGYDMIIKDGVSGDQITLYSHFYNANYAIDSLVYGDNFGISLTSALKITASTGNVTLNGTSGNDTLFGSSGTQTLQGNGGSDIYIAGTGSTSVYSTTGNDVFSYSSGNGILIINDTAGTDTLKLGSGMTSSNVILSEVNGYDLIITDGVSGDKITIINQQYVAPHIETLVYGDGSTMNLGTNLKIFATTGNSTVTGTTGNDTLIAVNGTGTETLNGGAGNDIYSYSSGNGLVAINEFSGTDTLKLGAGLTSANVTFTESSDGRDLLIADGVAGDQVRLTNQLYSSGYWVESLIYGDGSTISLTTGGIKVSAASGTAILNGTTGNDTLIGTAGSQSLNGGGGSDTFIGGSGTEWLNGTQGTNGNSTFIIGSGTTTVNGGTGSDIISFSSGNGTAILYDNGGTDTLKLGTGLTAANVFFTTSANGADLIITDSTAGDQIELKAQTTAGTAREKLIYGDGSTLVLSGVKMAGSAATTLNGTTGNDILVANTANLTLAGAGGTDIYDFGRGMGHDFINNGISANNTALGTLDFGHGIAKNQLWFDRVDGTGAISSSGNNLRITIMGTSSYITVNDEFNGTNVYRHLAGFAISDTGYKLDSQLSSLVSAMATFETNYASSHGGTAFDPTAVGNTSISDATVLTAVNSAWHS